mmetsp:Transcript_36896/g.82418  ORF Transcript_36896/g.82418 Transcript_36896/m.82418 type:complete len:730 (+) Transcript_36896:38-2227(+)
MSKGAWYGCVPACELNADGGEGSTPNMKAPKSPKGHGTSAQDLLLALAPRWSAGPGAAQRLAEEAIDTAFDLAKLDKEDLRELGLAMAERSRVLEWSSSVALPRAPAPPERLLRLASDLPITVGEAEFAGSPVTSADTPWVEIEATLRGKSLSPLQIQAVHSLDGTGIPSLAMAEEQRLDEIEGQADFWCSCFAASESSESLLAEGQVEDLHDVRENVLEAFFDCTPERVREVFASTDSEDTGHLQSVQHLRGALERCGVSGLDQGTLSKIFERVSGTGRTLHLAAFETILCRLRLASLLARPWRANLSVVDFSPAKASDQYIDGNNMRSYFFGHRPGARSLEELLPMRWVHMPQYDLHLLLALTVKYSLHPLSVEDVIEQCPTKIDRLAGNYFLAIELLTLVENGQGSSKGRQPVRVRGQHVAAFCSGPPRLDTLITIMQADRKFHEDWPGGPGAPAAAQTCPTTFGSGWPEKLRQRLKATRSRLRERRADALLYTVVDLCADELVTVTRAFLARLSWLEEDLRTRGDESLLDLGEVSLAQLQLGIVARRLRSLQRVVRRASEYQELHTTGSADYWKDCADHLDEAYDDAMQMKERCAALKAAHENAMERGQAAEMQSRHDESAVQAEKLNSMLFFLTAATTLFTPVQFMSSVYGMNFMNEEGVPTIPELLNAHGYNRFWMGVTAYFAIAFTVSFVLYQRLQRQYGKKARRRALPCGCFSRCCCCCCG